jgi:hypothetical protein
MMASAAKRLASSSDTVSRPSTAEQISAVDSPGGQARA